MMSHSFSKTWSGSPLLPLQSISLASRSLQVLAFTSPFRCISHHTNQEPRPQLHFLNMPRWFNFLALAHIIVFPWSSHYNLLTTSLSFKD